jgi:hypothetical protein
MIITSTTIAMVDNALAAGRESISAGILAMRSGDNAAAEGHFTEAIETLDDTDSSLPDAYLGRSCARGNLGQDQASMDDFDKFLTFVARDFTDPRQAVSVALQVRSLMCG